MSNNILFHLNPNDYGDGFFVAAGGEESAKASFKYYFEDNKDENSLKYFNEWFCGGKLPGKYTLDKHNSHKAVRHEIA